MEAGAGEAGGCQDEDVDFFGRGWGGGGRNKKDKGVVRGGRG